MSPLCMAKALSSTRVMSFSHCGTLSLRKANDFSRSEDMTRAMGGATMGGEEAPKKGVVGGVRSAELQREGGVKQAANNLAV